MAVVLAPRLHPLHILGHHAELMLEHAADPQPRGLLIVADGEALALQVLWMILSDARGLADDDIRVREVPIVEHGQETIGEVLRPLDKEGRERHLGQVVAAELELVVEDAGHAAGHPLVVQRDAGRFDLARDEREHAIVRSHRERQVEISHDRP